MRVADVLSEPSEIVVSSIAMLGLPVDDQRKHRLDATILPTLPSPTTSTNNPIDNNSESGDGAVEEEKKEKQKNQQKHCRFGSVDVAWYTMTLGSNPGGSVGPPLELGQLQRQEHFESHQQCRQALHSGDIVACEYKLARRIPRDEREDIVAALGCFTPTEIARATKAAFDIRLSRIRRSQEDVLRELIEEAKAEVQALETKLKHTGHSSSSRRTKGSLRSIFKRQQQCDCKANNKSPSESKRSLSTEGESDEMRKDNGNTKPTAENCPVQSNRRTRGKGPRTLSRFFKAKSQ